MKGSEKMDARLSIEKKRDLLEKKRDEDLQTEHDLKLQITQEFEELKHVEVSLERRLAQKHRRTAERRTLNAKRLATACSTLHRSPCLTVNLDVTLRMLI